MPGVNFTTKLFTRILTLCFQRMALIYSRIAGKPVLHFLHVGKTGGSALRESIRAFRGRKVFFFVLHDHRYGLHDIPQGENFFFSLRHPISRFVSGFYSRHRQGKPRYSIPWTDAERFSFSRFQRANQLARALSSATPQERDDARLAMSHIGHVRDHFSKWFDCEEYFQSRLCDLFFILFQEKLDSDFNKLKLLTKLPEHLGLPTDSTLAHKAPPSVDKHLDDTAIKNLELWYAQDIRFFNFCVQIARQWEILP